jgi:hypothetical protein
VEHIEEHDLTTDDVDYVLENFESKGRARAAARAFLATFLTVGILR